MAYKNYWQELADKWRDVDPLPVSEAFEVLRVALAREEDRITNLSMAHEDYRNRDKPPSESYRDLWERYTFANFARERLESLIPNFYCLGLFETQRRENIKLQSLF